MAAAGIEFELVSPEALVLSETVDRVTVPGTEGDMGFLPRHAPVISSLRPGVIRTVKGGAADKAIFVAGGFVEMANDRCTVLAEEAVPVASLKADELAQQVQNAAEDAEDAKDPHQKKNAEAKLEILKAKLQAATGRYAAA
jgi:F-type H+-transporting ATPase subunit epsilon